MKNKRNLFRYVLVPAGMAVGAFAGVWGVIAGGAAGAFTLLILLRLDEEHRWRSTVEQGSSVPVGGEPFPGALFVCAITVYCTGSCGMAAQIVRSEFSDMFHADWNSFCRVSASVENLNGDLLVECLAHCLKKNGAQGTVSSELIRRIFSVLNTAEFTWDDENRGVRPSRYLAELLDYTYAGDVVSTAYRVLGLAPGASFDQVKAAHRKLAAKYHPDTGSTGSGDASAFLRVQNAYEIIARQRS